jgi:hypothetical protein
VGERGREGGWRGGERGREENGGRETFFFERRESSERFNNNIPLKIFGRPFNLRAARRRMRRARGAASAKGAGEKKPPRAQERAGGYEPSSPSFFLFPTLFFTSSFLRCSTFFVSVCARSRVCVTEPHFPRFEILKVESGENKWRAVSFFFPSRSTFPNQSRRETKERNDYLFSFSASYNNHVFLFFFRRCLHLGTENIVREQRAATTEPLEDAPHRGEVGDDY